jgi:hypothetical protein
LICVLPPLLLLLLLLLLFNRLFAVLCCEHFCSPFITITRTGDTTRLPVARTCFRSIDLPDYVSKVQLLQKLRLFLDSALDEFGKSRSMKIRVEQTV